MRCARSHKIVIHFLGQCSEIRCLSMLKIIYQRLLSSVAFGRTPISLNLSNKIWSFISLPDSCICWNISKITLSSFLLYFKLKIYCCFLSHHINTIFGCLDKQGHTNFSIEFEPFLFIDHRPLHVYLFWNVFRIQAIQTQFSLDTAAIQSSTV